MIKSFKIVVIVIVLVFLYVGFLDKTVLHMAGLKTLEKLAFAHTFLPRSTQTIKNEEEKMREAGYQWAEDNNILDKTKCQNENASFMNGCKAYVYDNGEDTLQDQDNALDQ